jgi:CDP-diacylglycerol--glycerol-3-phosphate 3-phosphatidyltransferase
MTLNIPNLLTLLRILLLPIFVIVFYLPFYGQYLVCAAIFALAALTDWVDGYLARRLNQTTIFGAFIDPVADKLMVAVALVLIVSVYADPWLTIPAAIIICREIVVSALREWMAELSLRAHVAVSNIAKYKTAMQMISLLGLLIAKTLQHEMIVMIAYLLLYIAAFLTLYTMMLYLRAAWPYLRDKAFNKYG